METRREEAVTKLKLVRETFATDTGVKGGYGCRGIGAGAEEWGLRTGAAGSAGMAGEPCSATGGRRIPLEGSGWRVSLMTGLLSMDGLNLIGQFASRRQVVHRDNPY